MADLGPAAAGHCTLAGVPGGKAAVSTHVAQVPGKPPSFQLYRLQAHRWGKGAGGRAGGGA